MKESNITWVSTISAELYNSHYKHAIDTWHLLPGKKILYLEGEANIPSFIHKINFWETIETATSSWLSKKRPTKATRFWFKGHTVYHSLKQKYSKYVIWLDADVLVKKTPPMDLFSIDSFPFAAMKFKHSLFPDGHLIGDGVESGLQIFDTENMNIDNIAEDYYSYWESEEIFKLYRPYDNWVSLEIMKKYPSLNLVKKDHTNRYVGENSFIYTDFGDYFIHYLGKHNKEKIKEYIA